MFWTIRWINNIQAHWGLPYAYRLGKKGGGGGKGKGKDNSGSGSGKGKGSGGGCAGHSEPKMRSTCAVQDKVTFGKRAKKGINF